MRLFLSVIGMTAALVMAGVSASMNYVFLASLGKTPIEGQILGAASAAADLLKCLLPFFIAWAWRAGRYVAAVSGTGVFSLFAAFSLLSAIGFAADNRGVLVESRAAIDETYERIHGARTQLQSQLSALPPHRPEAVITEELQVAAQNRLWSRSKSCTEATETTSREFCAGYYRVRAELAAAKEAQRLSKALEARQTEMDRLKANGAGRERDPQVAILAKLFALSQDHVRLALIVAVALVVEFGSSLGLYLAGGHGTVRARREDEQPSPPPPAEMEARPVGDVEDFVLEELMPVPGDGLSLLDLKTAYAAWCARGQHEALEPGAFANRFAALAEAVKLRERGGQYTGIAFKTGKAAA